MVVVPRVTHQIWFQGWHELPPRYHGYTEKLEILNQNWEHMKWDEEGLRTECTKFSPEALAKFESFTQMIQKIDFGRYVVLHNYGGVSVDCDAECLRPLDKIPYIDKFDCIISKNSLNRIENKLASFGMSQDLTMLNNATIGCSKEHPLMKRFIEFLIENESWNEDETIDTQLKTGPLIMSMFFNKFLDDVFVADAEIFEPWGHVTKRTILDHKYTLSWLDSVVASYMADGYKHLRNNLLIVLFLILCVVLFVFIRKFAKAFVDHIKT